MYGRLQLLQAMNWHETAKDGSGDRIIYGDTDSMMVYVGPGDASYPTDKTLGGFKEEAQISRICVLGKKSYGYEEKDKFEEYYDEDKKCFAMRKKVVIRAKGFTQSYKANQSLTLDRLKEIACSENKELDQDLEQLHFYEEGTEVYMEKTTKKLSRCYNSGQLIEYPNGDIAAVPFGWKQTTVFTSASLSDFVSSSSSESWLSY